MTQLHITVGDTDSSNQYSELLRINPPPKEDNKHIKSRQRRCCDPPTWIVHHTYRPLKEDSIRINPHIIATKKIKSTHTNPKEDIILNH
jgi:hypothetical protein